MNPNLRLGHDAERAAEAFLRRIGYRTLARRARTAHGELDLVMRHGDTIVFVEVKARSDPAAQPQFAVNAEKRRHLISAARAFLASRRWHDAACRFDIVTVVSQTDGTQQFTHYRDAFTPTRW